MGIQSVGYLFFHKDKYVSLVVLKQELNIFLFEINIIKLVLNEFLNKNIKTLDASVGDWKCQVRSSMIVDIFSDDIAIYEKLSKELQNINKLIESVEAFLENLNSFNSVQCQKFSHEELQKLSLGELLKSYNFLYLFSDETIFLGLSFLTTVKNEILSNFINFKISTNKSKAILNQSKRDLCHLTVEYEQRLARIYGSIDNQKSLKQLEHKAMQYMTSLLMGFIPIFQKMKVKQEPFLINYIQFCDCGGVQNIISELIQFKNTDFVKILSEDYKDHVVTVIQVYQYPGSLQDLQAKLNISLNLTMIPVEHYRLCACTKPWQVNDHGYSLEEKIMGFFAQHPQFTNHAEINWKGLELEDSDLKKQYEYWLTIKGVSQKDMSVFQINHMYASTVGQELEDQRQLLLKLGKK